MAIYSRLEEIEIVASWEAAKRKFVPQLRSSREKTGSMKLSVNEWNIKKARVVCFYRGSKTCVPWKNFDRRDHSLKFLRALSMKVAIEEGKTSNIPSVRKWLQSAKKLITNQPTQTILDSIKTLQRSLGCARPDMTAIFHSGAYLTFVEVENCRRRQILLGTVE